HRDRFSVHRHLHCSFVDLVVTPLLRVHEIRCAGNATIADNACSTSLEYAIHLHGVVKHHPVLTRARSLKLPVVSIASVETTGSALPTSVLGGCYAQALGTDRDHRIFAGALVELAVMMHRVAGTRCAGAANRVTTSIARRSKPDPRSLTRRRTRCSP